MIQVHSFDFGQQKVITMTKPITEDAITQLYYSTLPKSLVIADLGCSSGPNTLFVVSELIKVVDQLRRKSGHDQSPEYQVFLNDLPGNDFNTIFKSLPSFQEKMSNQLGAGVGPCFFTGVPGSFYGRLFPTKTLHFVHSSYSLQWLSKVINFFYKRLMEHLVLPYPIIKDIWMKVRVKPCNKGNISIYSHMYYKFGAWKI